MDHATLEQLPENVHWLAQGPNPIVKKFKRHIVNCYKFCTKNNEEYKKTKNSGVCVAVEGGIDYYGVLTDITKFNYFDRLNMYYSISNVIGSISIWVCLIEF